MILINIMREGEKTHNLMFFSQGYLQVIYYGEEAHTSS